MVNSDLIVKSNYIVEASYKLSLGEQRVIYVLTSLISSDDTEFRPYKISVKEFTDILGSKSKDMYSQVPKYVDELRDKDLTIVKEKSVLKTKWLSSAEYFINDGYVELCFDPKLKPYLLMLKERFTKLSLSQMVSFKSQYSGRIYELLKQYIKIGERTFIIENLKGLLGIEYGEYRLYADFKRKIILKSQKEINEKSDIKFEFEEIKTGRKVTSLKFYIKSNKSNVIENKKEIKNIKAKVIEEVSATESESEENTIYYEIINKIKVICNEKISLQNAKEFYELASNHELGTTYPLGFIEEVAKYSKTQDVKGFIGWFKRMLIKYERPIKANKQLTFDNFEGRGPEYYGDSSLEKQLLGWDKD